MDEGFPVLLNNYTRILGGIAGGGLLRDTSAAKVDYDLFEIQSQKLYSKILERLFLQAKKDKRTFIFNSVTLICTIIAAITGCISLLKS